MVTLAAGDALFKIGAIDDSSFFLLSGELVLSEGGKTRTVIKAGSEAAGKPISNRQPRRATCIARTPCKLFKLSRRLLEVVLTWDHNAGMDVTDIGLKQQEGVDLGEETGDWMAGLLQSKAFMRLPPSNLQVLFHSMKEIHARQGSYVIRQGEEGDYYYLIKRGRCEVLRKSSSGAEIKLAELKTGDSFGEESLLSRTKRNASVRMLVDSVLMRLSKQAFNELLKPPLLPWVSRSRAKEMVLEDGAVWVDVRLESEHKENAIDGSINIPLFMLRLKADILDRKRKYIMYCDSGRRSSVAAFLLNERGVQAYCLRGGLSQHR